MSEIYILPYIMTHFLKKQEKNYSVLSPFFFKKKIDCDSTIIIPLLVIKTVCINNLILAEFKPFYIVLNNDITFNCFYH